MSWRQDLRVAIRALTRSPGYPVTAVVSLAVGIGAGTSAFGVVDAVRFRALPFEHGERLVVVSEVPAEAMAGRVGASRGCRAACDVSYVVFANVLQRTAFRTVNLVAGYTGGAKSLNTGEEPILLLGGVVSPNLFDLLGVRPILGRPFLPEDDRLGAEYVVLLSHELWSTQFGSDPSIVGRIVKLSDTRYTVIGVMPKGFDHEVGSEFWLPAVPTLDPSTRPSIRSLTVIARLAPGRTVEQFQAELAALDPEALQTGSRAGDSPIRLTALPLRDRYTESTRSHDLGFAAVVGCVLLIAIANLANLVLVRTLHQRRELAVRTALGARPARLLRGLLLEHLLVVAVAAVLGLVLAHWLLRVLGSLDVLSSLRPGGMEYQLDLRTVAFAVVLALGIGALLTLAPAAIVSRTGVQRLLREGGPTATGGRWGGLAQRVFVIGQMAAAVILLTGAGLMARTVLRLSRLDLGFEAANVVQGTPSYPHPWRVKETFVPVTREILGELERQPSAASVAVRADQPLAGRDAEPVLRPDGWVEPLPGGLAPRSAIAVSPGYFRTLGVRMVQGREFEPGDTESGMPVAIVNRWAAERWWPGQEAIGRTIRVDTAANLAATLVVVGVVADNLAAQPSLLLADVGPELYRPYEQAPSAFPTFLVRARGSTATLLRPVRDVLVRRVPDRPVFIALLSERVEEQLAGVRVNALQILAFALVGLGLALVGIHGLLSYAVSRRVREIGIRGALGASRGAIARMVVGDTARMTGVGLAIGLPIAVRASRLIEDLLHGTKRGDPLVLVLVALGVTVVSVLASYVPARRGARVDPIIVLREP